MAPAKKSKSINKGFDAVNSFSPNKDDKYKHKKRKFSDMLGPQWSKHELERFYEAYRKFGIDWKKVASVVRSRSKEMVEALYNMNRAYLSLPEGTASVVGLIAMMTDHYNVMEGSGSERDKHERMAVAHKSHKHLKARGRIDSPRQDAFQHQSIGSADRCLSLLKMCYDGIQPFFPVRKRTPRVPVSCLDIHPSKKSREPVMEANDDEASHGSLMLTEEQQTPCSQRISQAAHRKVWQIRTSPEEKASLAVKPKQSGTIVDDESAGLVRGSVDSGKFVLAGCKKGKKGKKEEDKHTEAKLFDDIREAYISSDRASTGEVRPEGADAKICISPFEGQKKRKKKLTYEDESAACDALRTLAEMSLMMPYLAAESVEDGGESIAGRDSRVDINAHSDATLKDESANGEYKKKRKFQAYNNNNNNNNNRPSIIPNESGSRELQNRKFEASKKAEMHAENSRKIASNEILADEEVKSADSSVEISAATKRCKSSVRSPGVSSSNDQQTEEAEVALSSTQVHPARQVNPTRRNSRKRNRISRQIDRHYVQSACSSECSSSLQDGVQSVKEKLSRCLYWRDVRRWCVYEWFYSALDYPWFAKREFVEYLNHVGLGHIPRLTRVEWGVIRSSLGKPRRFSERFLQEEREKLTQYRESVRTHYANLRAGLGEGLPTDLARPLSVGQQVVAIHPKTREFHNGSILTVDRDNYLVQFDHTNLGVELVMDIDCMPLNPVENMPEALRRQKLLFDYGHSQVSKVNGSFTLASEKHVQNVNYYLHMPPCSPSIANEMKGKPASTSSHPKADNGSLRIASSNGAEMQARKGDMKPLPGLIQSVGGKVLDQRGTYAGKLPYWPQPLANSVGVHGTIHSFNNSVFSCQEAASGVAEIVQGSREKAQRMVDTAFKAISLRKEGEDAYERIRESLDSTNRAEPTANCRVISSNTGQGSLASQNSVTPCIPEQQLSDDASGPQVPSDLITSCVATLLMIQSCTERQYPPAEVAQILDNAVKSLQPCCPQNLSVYREIQMCMGRIKTQILAQVPT